MTFLEFEKPIEQLYEQLYKTKQIAEKSKVNMNDVIAKIEEKIYTTRQSLYAEITDWQRVLLSRHPDRPYSLDYIENITTDFIELHGDRLVGDDSAMIGGLGTIGEYSAMFIGQQKGRSTKQRQFRNFGMANPEGYRKALRLMKLAEKFNKPVICLIDTPGAYPGLEAEERGQGEAIARNLIEMIQLKVPLICIIIGEGASGGALGIGIGDKVLMMENTWYTVISPESCSSILWHTWEHKEKAAEALKLTASHMIKFGLIDGIITEPLGGAHTSPEEAFAILKKVILNELHELVKIKSSIRIENRINKYEQMGKALLI